LHEKLLEILFISFLADSTNENLACFLLLIPRDRAFWINLELMLAVNALDSTDIAALERMSSVGIGEPYDFAIQIMFLNHNGVHGFWISKS
jgi:hypothetical protein